MTWLEQWFPYWVSTSQCRPMWTQFNSVLHKSPNQVLCMIYQGVSALFLVKTCSSGSFGNSSLTFWTESVPTSWRRWSARKKRCLAWQHTTKLKSHSKKWLSFWSAWSLVSHGFEPLSVCWAKSPFKGKFCQYSGWGHETGLVTNPHSIILLCIITMIYW